MNKIIKHITILCLISNLTAQAWAVNDTAFHKLSAGETATLIRDGELKSEDLVRALLERIEQHGNLNAFITVDTQGALKAALAADLAVMRGGPAGRLHGVPVAVKDNIAVAGLPLTAGTKSLADNIATEDAEIVKLLKREGAIIIGKTNLHELGFGVTSANAVFGDVQNPYQAGYTAGGSSGGSAAAVAAGLVPLALGADTGGSVRIPAALCGIIGYRPSVGRYPTQGLIPMAATKDTPGFMASTMTDIILADSIVMNYDPARIQPLDLQGLRIGIPGFPFYKNLDAAVFEQMKTAMGLLEHAGCVLVYQDLPPPTINELNRWVDFRLVAYETRRDLPPWLATNTGINLQQLTAGITETSIRQYFQRFVLGAEVVGEAAYHQGLTQRLYMQRVFADYFAENRVDFIIVPATVLPAIPHSQTDDPYVLDGQFTVTANAYLQNTGLSSNVGLAGITLPAGLTALSLPVGLEINALPGNDEALLGLALALETVLEPLPAPAKY